MKILNLIACITLTSLSSFTYSAAIDRTQPNRNERLLQAARDGNITKIQQLLDAKVDINHVDYYRKTALHYAAEYGQTKAVQLLLAAGAHVDHLDGYNLTALVYATRPSIVQALLNARASVNTISKPDKMTPLMYEAQEANIEKMKLFLDAHADIEFANSCGTAIGYAISNHYRLNERHLTAISLLLAYDASAETTELYHKEQNERLQEKYLEINLLIHAVQRKAPADIVDNPYLKRKPAYYVAAPRKKTVRSTICTIM